jgi:hypothetical protein
MSVDIFGPGPRTVTVTKTAGANLSGHRVVRPQADGTVVYADPSDAAAWGAGPWWLTQRAVMAGASDDLLAVGEITEPSWAWVPGTRLFLGTLGALSTVPPPDPTRMVQVAVAQAGTTIFFDPQMPIETTA